MSIVQVLTEARSMIEKGWTQGWFAKTADGERVLEKNPKAVCWCMAGAYWATAPDWSARNDAEGFLRQATGDESITNWNDTPGRTQQEVLAAYDKAIELAKEAA